MISVRSFLTGFDREKFIDIGNRDITRIFRLGQHIDKLIRAKTGLKGRKNQDKRHRISQKINRFRNYAGPLYMVQIFVIFYILPLQLLLLCVKLSMLISRIINPFIEPARLQNRA